MRNISFKQRAQGFTLVEVLVSLVVMAVGMLGIAALYIEGLQSGTTSVIQANAVNLAADMADRIRVNSGANVAYAGGGPGTNVNNCVNGLANCTPAQLALDDWFWWTQDIQNRMPPGAFANIGVANPGGGPLFTYTIFLSWPERGQLVNSTYTLVFSQ